MDYLFNILLFILVALILVINELINNNAYKGAMRSNVHTLNMFQSYVKKFNKTYTDSEFLQRLKNFEESLEEISRLNKLHDANVFGLTEFSDWSMEEFSGTMLSGLASGECHDQHMNCTRKAYRRNKNNSIHTYHLPEKYDWRDKGVVFPVLDQKLCAGCWAFSIVGVMESRAAIHGKRKIRRSIQEVLDCSAYNRGCNKGDIRLALNYLCSNNYPVVTEKEYPLTLRDEACEIPEGQKPTKGLRIAEYTNACNVNEALSIDNVILREIAINGPVVAAVNASPWKNYIDGVIKAACKGTWESLNHAIQIVGYDLTAPVPYYIIRNSWGKYYGNHGYMKLAIGGNVCGIADNVAYFSVSYNI